MLVVVMLVGVLVCVTEIRVTPPFITTQMRFYVFYSLYLCNDLGRVACSRCVLVGF